MIGVLVITHGEMASGLKNSVEMIMGENDHFDTLGLYPEAEIIEFKEEIRTKIIALNKNNGVLIIVDLFGASPYNLTAANIGEMQVEEIPMRMITGANLPMAIEALNSREYISDIDELYKVCMKSAKEGVREFFDEMNDISEKDE